MKRFFFSSRRRHTRYWRDWSSDVCSSDLQVGISGHITIGDKVFLGAQSGVPGSLKENQTLIGTPPMEKLPYFKSQAIFQKLPDLYKEINQLKKEIELLKKS